MQPYIPPPARTKSWRRPFSNQSSSTTKPSQPITTTKTSNPLSSSFSSSSPSSKVAVVQTNDGNRLKPFSRLKPAPIQKDPLQAAGLPSKGDTSLLSPAAQETYYAILNSRYMTWYAATKPHDTITHQTPRKPSTTSSLASAASTVSEALSDELSSMSLDGPSYLESPIPHHHQSLSTDQTTESSILLMSMRKLRESLLSTSRTDAFAQTAYTFIIRASILLHQPSSHHPALHHLLTAIHPLTPLSKSTLHEFTSYLILDTACRVGDIAEALCLRAEYGFRDQLVDALLKALMRDDYVSFWRVRGRMDGYCAALVGWAEEGVRRHALKCVGRGYLSIDRVVLERVAGGRRWVELVGVDGVGWELESAPPGDGNGNGGKGVGEVVVVRKIKGGRK